MAAGWARANRIIWWEMESGKVGSVSGRIPRQDRLKLEYFRPRKEGRDFRINLTQQEGKESEAKGRKERNKGKEHGCRPVSE